MTITTVTYKRLDQALTRLGFSLASSSEFIVYKNLQHGAVIILPPGSPGDKVGLNHLLTAMATVVGKGIADESAFQRALRSRSGSVLAAPEAVEQQANGSVQRPGFIALSAASGRHNGAANGARPQTRQKILRHQKANKP